jgi:hypothetical protein
MEDTGEGVEAFSLESKAAKNVPFQEVISGGTVAQGQAATSG